MRAHELWRYWSWKDVTLFWTYLGNRLWGRFPRRPLTDNRGSVLLRDQPSTDWSHFFYHKIFPFSRSPTCHWCQSISHFGEYPPGTSAKCVFQALAHSLLLTNCYFYIGMLSFFRGQINSFHEKFDGHFKESSPRWAFVSALSTVDSSHEETAIWVVTTDETSWVKLISSEFAKMNSNLDNKEFDTQLRQRLFNFIWINLARLEV